MKIINLLLSIYLVALSCLPCADSEVVSSAASSEVATHQEEHSHDKDTDLCSPFCVCNCCGVHVLSYAPQLLFEPAPLAVLLSQKEVFYISPTFSSFYGTIWQPPQLA